MDPTMPRAMKPSSDSAPDLPDNLSTSTTSPLPSTSPSVGEPSASVAYNCIVDVETVDPVEESTPDPPEEDSLTRTASTSSPTSTTTTPKQEPTKKRTFKPRISWNEVATGVLLDVFSTCKYQKMFKSGKTSHKIIWTEIAKEVGARTNIAGLDYKICWDKLKYLKKKYKEVKRSLTSGSSGEPPAGCPHYDELDKIFSEDPTVIPEYEITRTTATTPESKPVPNPKRKKREELQTKMVDLSQATVKILQETSSQNAATNQALLKSMQTSNEILTALLTSLMTPEARQPQPTPLYGSAYQPYCPTPDPMNPLSTAARSATMSAALASADGIIRYQTEDQDLTKL